MGHAIKCLWNHCWNGRYSPFLISNILSHKADIIFLTDWQALRGGVLILCHISILMNRCFQIQLSYPHLDWLIDNTLLPSYAKIIVHIYDLVVYGIDVRFLPLFLICFGRKIVRYLMVFNRKILCLKGFVVKRTNEHLLCGGCIISFIYLFFE